MVVYIHSILPSTVPNTCGMAYNSIAVLGLSWDYVTTQYHRCEVSQNASVVVDLSICGTIHKL